MVSHLFYYHLALLALVWFFVMLHVALPTRGVPSPPAPAQPLKPRRKGVNEPKAFEGLTQKPHGALCERDTVQPKALPPTQPDPMPRRTDVLVRSTRRCTFVRRAIVPIVA